MATQLIPLREVERLSSNVIRILGGNPGKVINILLRSSIADQRVVHAPRQRGADNVLGSNTYLVGTGKQRLLIDTGEGKPSWIKLLVETLQKENATVTEAIITHWHHDHQGGIEHLQQFSPDVIIYKNQPNHLASSDGWLDIKEDQRFSVDGASLRAVHSPGHTTDHMALVLEEENAMFTGDNVLGHGTAVFEDLAAYMKSLEKMKDAFQGRAYPGHGPVIEDGPSKILEYIRHRKQREDQVIQVLKSSKSSPGAAAQAGEPDEWTSMEIVKIIYKDVPESLHLPANGGVLQVLRKLEEEEKVTEDSKSEKWKIKDRAAL
ncbi:Endoribonuclease LACTB2 [Lachnellula cervina]|uniref:Endoribonuclease LACTB2 n=1 Tax=Lachnellula cervina TaxID=1316786 RepID=A0A7D8UTI4_9HELO|nr:Endoribonuclease LACTB2 [Lachnellula cervina]